MALWEAWGGCARPRPVAKELKECLAFDAQAESWRRRRLLAAEGVAAADAAVVGCHVCGALSDALIEECLGAGVEFAVMPCCHGEKGAQGLATKQAAKVLGVRLGTLTDAARYGVIAAAGGGWGVRLRTIDAAITPENRILVGLLSAKGDQRAEQREQALGKLAGAYTWAYAGKPYVEASFDGAIVAQAKAARGPALAKRPEVRAGGAGAGARAGVADAGGRPLMSRVDDRSWKGKTPAVALEEDDEDLDYA